MPNQIAHFAIEADDVNRAKAFYEAVFDWQFSAWGPPDFYRITNAGIGGALQQRAEPIADGKKGYECSIAVNDVAATLARITASGGTVSGPTFTIPGVGELCQFADTEGNRAIVMQYTPEAAAEMGLGLG